VCLPIRAVDGTVMDEWTFERRGERESVKACGWMTTSNAHRDVVVALARAGHGVVRILDWTDLPDFAAGTLVRALDDWDSPEAPPVNLLYRAGGRRIQRVRLFIEFATELFRELDQVRGLHVDGTERPAWVRQPQRRVRRPA
jgi:DNA-binding transcriptional LysR family regulator